MTFEDIEKTDQRLSIIEKEIADLKRQLEDRPVSFTYYRCIAYSYYDSVIVCTNDHAYYELLMQNGGKMLCHYDLFTKDELFDPKQLVPYSVRIPLDKLAQLQPVPIDRRESYETQLYY